MNKSLVYLRPARLAYVRAVGPYEQSIPEAWDKMLGWLERYGFMAVHGRGYGLARDNPATVGAQACRYDACIPLEPIFEDRAQRELGVITLPGGSYARQRRVGSYDEIRTSLASVYNAYRPPAGLRFDAERPVVTIYLDDTRTHHSDDLRADLCIPVSTCSLRARAKPQQPAEAA